MRWIPLLLAGLLVAALPAWAKVDMKTHTSKAPGAKVTMVHFGAPW